MHDRMNLTALLAALAMVESGDRLHPAGNDYAIGKKGERGRYQITRTVWREVNPPWPHREARDSHKSAHVAIWHIYRVRIQMPEEWRESPWMVAAAWNCGVGRCKKAKWNRWKLPKRTQNFANRVAGLYGEKVRSVK